MVSVLSQQVQVGLAAGVCVERVVGEQLRGAPVCSSMKGSSTVLLGIDPLPEMVGKHSVEP